MLVEAMVLYRLWPRSLAGGLPPRAQHLHPLSGLTSRFLAMSRTPPSLVLYVVRKWLRTIGVCYAGPVTGPDVRKSLRRGLHRHHHSLELRSGLGALELRRGLHRPRPGPWPPRRDTGRDIAEGLHLGVQERPGRRQQANPPALPLPR